ncbi:hypothetical protein GGR52DRAFT_537597 [Hypoxylon sp. FL1284]|nr:hypothetical protein GGR52DRAFT_537597 [Hypoxylon sp. FL1284]
MSIRSARRAMMLLIIASIGALVLPGCMSPIYIGTFEVETSCRRPPHVLSEQTHSAPARIEVAGDCIQHGRAYSGIAVGSQAEQAAELPSSLPDSSSALACLSLLCIATGLRKAPPASWSLVVAQCSNRGWDSPIRHLISCLLSNGMPALLVLIYHSSTKSRLGVTICQSCMFDVLRIRTLG